ncbi:MAG: hypothetical protein QF655_01670 [Candidatus Woesearchaeota archaeon]|jgi:hypothetical protein|nr:hypothetical protein [Candidatus Woesearchaeota archaeon]MDP6265943.1 hypothetical protein [Candidatus Woesearchaeota archaeon]MDP7322622.1 hypothetical protein [Candidatus Woesearchaeota archaeon]MDP7476326.1 hypothetical protein [Candidatus Woesearchaeota archaeon]|tara:strand:+ start:8324 stop:8536 length:213 start_codon:yes stop_codon:yes gene_type:complete
MKKRLSEQQEFEIMKLVLDKFLWLGFILMAFGVYQMFANSISIGLIWFIGGVLLLILFMILIIKEYEIIR